MSEEKTKHLPNRRQLRVKIMQAVYAATQNGESARSVFVNLLDDYYKQFRKAAEENPEYQEEADFIKSLYYGVMEKEQELKDLVAQKLDKWDINRVALVDSILILMGMYELLNFNEIPVKVSINEYIEIAKTYSTEKSSQFVNGVLDAIQRQLQEEGKIKKVGRGLMENS